MAHPQSGGRGFEAFRRVDIGSQSLTYNANALLLDGGIALSGEETDVITQNSTAVLLSGGLALSGETTDIITQNSNALLLSAGIALSGEETDVVTQNSTSLILPSNLQMVFLSAVPSGRQAPGTFCMVGNSTGYMAAMNTTGTTWAYLTVTSVLA